MQLKAMAFFFAFFLLCSASAFTISSQVRQSSDPVGNPVFTLDNPLNAKSHANVVEQSISVDIAGRISRHLERAGLAEIDLFKGMHPVYTFSLDAVEPTTREKAIVGRESECLHRCEGPKARVVLRFQQDGRERTVNEHNFKRAGEIIHADNIVYKITDVTAPDFRKETYYDAPGKPTWFRSTSGNVQTSFCISFSYYSPVSGRIVRAGTGEQNSPCVKSEAEFISEIITANTADFLEAASEMIQVSKALDETGCDEAFARKTDQLELRARISEKGRSDAGNRTDFRFEETRGQLDSQKMSEGSIEFDLSNFKTIDSNASLYGSYKVELIAFNPKDLPEFRVRISELDAGRDQRFQNLSYSAGFPEHAYNLGELRSRFFVRLFTPQAEIEMPRFTATGISPNSMACYDAFLPFAIKFRMMETSTANPDSYTWYLTEKRELERLNAGPNLTVRVLDSEADFALIEDEKNAVAKIIFIDTMTGEERVFSEKVSGGTARFNAPMKSDIKLVVEAGEYAAFSKNIVIPSTADQIEEAILSPLHRPAFNVILSGRSFIALLNHFMPYYLGRELPSAPGQNLAEFDSDVYREIYSSLKEKHIFRLLDSQGNKVSYSISHVFSGTHTDSDNYILPLHTVLRFEDITLNEEYTAVFFIPREGAQGPLRHPVDYDQLEVIEIRWEFDADKGLVEGASERRAIIGDEW